MSAEQFRATITLSPEYAKAHGFPEQIEVVPSSSLQEAVELLALKDEYIAYLNEAETMHATYLHIHGRTYPAEFLRRGDELRRKIHEASAFLERMKP